MKKLVYMLVAAVILCAAPAFAQGPFADVPTDHWAYDAVNTLQNSGIIIGYPDGTFGGKRAMSRYEFAVAIARLWEAIGDIETDPGGNFVTESELNQRLQDYARKSDIPDVSKFATKADVDAIRRLVDEFRDELAALGVDVDALKRDVAALAARVDALEAMVKRVQFYGNVNVFAIATSSDSGSDQEPVDLDERIISTGSRDTLARSISLVQDFDLSVVGRVSETTTANATINYGNYLNYLAFVDDYVGGARPVDKTQPAGVGGTLSDEFFPYYLYIESGIGAGAVTVGRFPMQFTPYTFQKIDVDSYTSILKTDSGNYPVDGIKLGLNLFGVDWTFYAAKHDTNDYLINGLTGQPNAGLYKVAGPFHDAGGRAVGGLASGISQSAGVRGMFGGPWNANIGFTYYQAWARNEFFAGNEWDQARVFGADINIPIGSFGLAASWTQSDTLVTDGVAGTDVDDDNNAWDAKITANLGRLGIGAGYKQIERNFAAAGFWDKLGRWTNPTNIKGWYADLSYPLGSKLKLIANGAWYEMDETLPAGIIGALGGFGFADDKIIKAEAGLEWGLSKANSLALGFQWIKYDPDTDLDDGTEEYITIGWAHQFNQNAGLKIGYQFIDWDGGDDSIVYGSDYKGNLGVVQFGVSF